MKKVVSRIRFTKVKRGWWRVRSQSKIVNGVHNCERRSQNHQNELEFYASNHFLTISFLLQNHPSQPQSLLPLFARSACISKNFLKTIVNAVHNCERTRHSPFHLRTVPFAQSAICYCTQVASYASGIVRKWHQGTKFGNAVTKIKILMTFPPFFFKNYTFFLLNI